MKNYVPSYVMYLYTCIWFATRDKRHSDIWVKCLSDQPALSGQLICKEIFIFVKTLPKHFVLFFNFREYGKMDIGRGVESLLLAISYFLSNIYARSFTRKSNCTYLWKPSFDLYEWVPSPPGSSLSGSVTCFIRSDMAAVRLLYMPILNCVEVSVGPQEVIWILTKKVKPEAFLSLRSNRLYKCVWNVYKCELTLITDDFGNRFSLVNWHWVGL